MQLRNPIKIEASFSIINLRQAQLDKRLDAEYYNPEYLSKIKTLEDKKSQKIKDAFKVKIFSGPFGSFFKSESYLSEGHPFVRISDIKDIFLDREKMVFVNDDDFEKLKKYQLAIGDIVFSKIGTVGRLSIVTEEIGKIAISENNIGLAFPSDIKSIDKAYIAFFLLSDFGQKQIFRLASGNVQLKLNVSDIENLLIPMVSSELKSAFENALKIVHNKFFHSKKTYDEAEKFFLKEINLEGYLVRDENISIRNFKDCLEDDRFDAEYWQPKYDEMVKRVSSISQKELSEIVSVKKGVETGSDAYSEEGKLFVRVSDFSIYGVDEGEKRIPEELYEKLKENYRPHKGEVLFTKDGTIGISFALHEDIEAIVSGAFLRLKPKVKINIDYLALALNSSYCKSQIERMSGGAIIAHLKPDSAMKIKIPMLSDDKQEEIAVKVSDALRLRKEAKTLLEKAKRAVEIFIEKDEKEALKYLSE